MKSIRSDDPVVDAFASRGSIFGLDLDGMGGTGGTVVPSVKLRVWSPLGVVGAEADAPWMCAERNECRDVCEALGRIGATVASL